MLRGRKTRWTATDSILTVVVLIAVIVVGAHVASGVHLGGSQPATGSVATLQPQIGHSNYVPAPDSGGNFGGSVQDNISTTGQYDSIAATDLSTSNPASSQTSDPAGQNAPADSSNSSSGALLEPRGATSSDKIVRTDDMTLGITTTLDNAQHVVSLVDQLALSTKGAFEAGRLVTMSPISLQATITMAVPSPQFDGLLHSLRNLPNSSVDNEGLSTEDQSALYLATTNQLVDMEATAKLYEKLLAAAKDPGTLNTIESQLTTLDQQIGQLQGQAAAVASTADYSWVTLNISFTSPTPLPTATPSPTPTSTARPTATPTATWSAGASFSGATGTAIPILADTGTALVYLAVFIPLILLYVVPLLLLYLAYRRWVQPRMARSSIASSTAAPADPTAATPAT